MSSPPLVFKSNKRLRFVGIHFGVSNSAGHEEQAQCAEKLCESVIAENRFARDCESIQCRSKECLKHVARPYIQTKAEEAVIRLVTLMEDEPSLNCGNGSNLNMYGQVECDASLMRNKDCAIACVGAITGCKNPIKLAESLLFHRVISRPLGLVQPNILVGSSGGKKWMNDHCPSLIIHDSKLIARNSFDRYQRYKSDYDRIKRSSDQNSSATQDLQGHLGFDTVGAIAIDEDGNIACAASSGGIALKHKGRLGQAAIPGAGCWTRDSVAVTTTGVGELLTGNLFAKEICDKLRTMAADDTPGGSDLSKHIESIVKECFLEIITSPVSHHLAPNQRVVGALVAVALGDVDIYLVACHNSKSMCISYHTNDHQKSKSEIIMAKNHETEVRVIRLTPGPHFETSIETENMQLESD